MSISRPFNLFILKERLRLTGSEDLPVDNEDLLLESGSWFNRFFVWNRGKPHEVKSPLKESRKIEYENIGSFNDEETSPSYPHIALHPIPLFRSSSKVTYGWWIDFGKDLDFISLCFHCVFIYQLFHIIFLSKQVFGDDDLYDAPSLH